MSAAKPEENFGAKGVSLAAIAFVLLCGNITFAAQDASTRAAPRSELKSAASELHVAPDFAAPAHGLRETSAEETQRLEVLQRRHSFPRHGASLTAWSLFRTRSDARLFCKPLLTIDAAAIDANLVAVAHANLTSRYPIPPPATAL